MDLTLEKVDQLRDRAGVSFSEAVAALEKADGDVVKALLFLEEQGESLTGAYSTGNSSSQENEKSSRVSQFVGKTKKMNIKICKGKRNLVEVPFLLALGTTFLFPKFWAWVVVGLFAARFSLLTGQQEDSP